MAKGEALKAEHNDIQFRDVAVFYNFVFDVGKTVNPINEARRLLRTDLGIATPNYLTNEIEIASRFSHLLNMQGYMRQLGALERVLKEEGLRGLVKGTLRHPKRSFNLWRSTREMGKRSRNMEIKDIDDETTKKDERSTQDIADETNQFIDDAMTNVQSLMAIQLASDHSLFSPIYLVEIPFARVELQPFFASINGEEFAVDVSVLIHRSGVAIISFFVNFRDEKSVDELIAIERAGLLEITTLKIAKPVLEWRQGLKQSALDWPEAKTHFESGVEWLEIENIHETSLTEVMRLYQGAVIRSIHGRKPKLSNDPYSWARTQDWFIYPVLFVKETSPSFLTGNELKRDFSEQVAGLVLKYPEWRKLKPELVEDIMKKDLSLVTDKSLFINEGSTTVFLHGPYWANLARQFGADIPGEHWAFSYFQTTGLIDVLLLQKWVLHTIRSELRGIKNNFDNLNSTRRTLILSLDDYRSMNVSYGSAQNILEECRKLMRIEELYDDVLFKLSSVEKLIDVAESRHRYRRDLFLRLSVTIVTLILGLPGTKQVIDILSSWRVPSESFLPRWSVTLIERLLSEIRLHPVFSMLSLYCLIVVVLGFAMVWSLRKIKSKKPMVLLDQSESALSPSFTWPGKPELNNDKDDLMGG